ncbi:hypothetical protein HG535_0C00800 [Zygotorulaspora mrakii]|uniref:Ribosomal protein L1 n=1 Tax=Zygotorulaspora mrakii TaxID=42260 RepID=A0A7H9AZG4_ZYGMR|nr:uncharacterized protein HG535_0C00800 [Zygotorulaspora mrakii]QLG71731.1 hypothetical protein HG535_0C00800 [Zygotorulaspora mrakii]
MTVDLQIDRDGTAGKALGALLEHCKTDSNLQKDKNIHMIISTNKKMGAQKDSIPRIIPLTSCKLNKPKDFRTLLITKDPSNVYRDALTKDAATSELFKEIIGLKSLKRRFRGIKITQLYKEFDLIVADFRVLHLLPDILGQKFYRGNKKLPYAMKMSREMVVKGKKTIDVCDPLYVRAQLRSICKNTSYVPNNDNCLSVRIGQVNKTTVPEMLGNIRDIISFLTDKSKKPQGGTIKGGICSIFVKTTNSPSLPVYEKNMSTPEEDDSENIKLK